MSIFDGIFDNIDDVAAKLGLPAEQVQAVVANLKDKVAGGGNPLEALSAAAQEHGLSLDHLKSMLPDGGDGLMGKATSMLDKNGDGSVLDDLQGMAKGLFGKS
ncbi:MAG: hypothetical protein J7498_04890 [Sphingobium sp.]|nr:hypothetical protein [Sphingobium sp.]